MIKLITPKDGTYLFSCEVHADIAALMFKNNKELFLEIYKKNRL